MKLIHHHNWKKKSSCIVNTYEKSSSTRPFKSITEILYECAECGKLKSGKLKGAWDLND